MATGIRRRRALWNGTVAALCLLAAWSISTIMAWRMRNSLSSRFPVHGAVRMIDAPLGGPDWDSMCGLGWLPDGRLWTAGATRFLISSPPFGSYQATPVGVAAQSVAKSTIFPEEWLLSPNGTWFTLHRKPFRPMISSPAQTAAIWLSVGNSFSGPKTGGSVMAQESTH